MADLKKKVCLLGPFAVGKTSLVRRYVSGFFSDRYLSTIGVKIDVKTIKVGGKAIDLVMWDIAGSSRDYTPEKTYLRGLAGYMIVGDGTRPDTCQTAVDLVHYVEDLMGPRPNVLLLNKADLVDDWRLGKDDAQRLTATVDTVIKTSAKTGEAVAQAFAGMAQLLVNKEC